MLSVAGWLLLVVAVAGSVVRYIDSGSHVVIAAAAGAWVLAALAVPALVVQLAARHWVAAAVAGAVVIVQVVVYGPLFIGQTPPHGGTDLHVMTQNLYLGQADAAQIVQRVRDEHVDLLMLEELTPEAVQRLDAAGLGRELPHSFARPRKGAAGTGLWSRTPLTDEVEHPGFFMENVSATTLIGGTAVTVFAVHPTGPYPYPSFGWRSDTAGLRTLVHAVPAGRVVVVGGDFNATTDTARFRHLLEDGYRDAAEQAGAGIVRTWPANAAIPPTIGIDHVLTRGAVATSATAVRTHDTDHLGLVVTVVLPR